MKINNPKKSRDINNLINEALDILATFGVPIDQSPNRKRRLEKMAMTFLAVVGVNKKTLGRTQRASPTNTHFALET